MKRKFIIRKSTIFQYICIFIMLFLNQSSMFHNLFGTKVMIIALIFLVLLFLKKKFEKHIIGFLIVLIIFCVFGRFYSNGGVGISTWAMWAAMIASTYYAIIQDEHMAPTRFVNLIYFIAVISIVGFIISLSMPSIIRSIGYSYNNISEWRAWTSSTQYTVHNYLSHDLIFYVLNDNHLTRNCGMFTEPGIYQMVLNSAIFLLLFFDDYLYIEEKKKMKMIMVLVITLLTTQSTTGYFGLAAMILLYLLDKKSENRKLQRRIAILVMIGIILLMGDYGIRGTQSFIGNTIMGKLFTTSGEFSLSANTGDARAGAILLCLASMIMHPLGIGYTEVHSLLNVQVTGYLAAQIMQTGAALGIIPFIVILYWIFNPVLKFNTKPIVKICYIIIYFNTALAQSREFYPTLIFIPLMCYILRKRDKRKNKNRIYVNR